MPVPNCPKSWTVNLMRILLCLRDAVKHTPGGSRFTTAGRQIQPLGCDYAEEVTGRRPGYMDTALNPEDDRHLLSFVDFVLLLQAGLDISVMDELERLRGRVAFDMPNVGAHGDLATELMALGKEFGDVFTSLSDAMREDSPGGHQVTPKEFRSFSREVDELISKACELREAVRKGVA